MVLKPSILKPEAEFMEPSAPVVEALFAVKLVILVAVLPSRPMVLMKLFQLEAMVAVVVLKKA